MAGRFSVRDPKGRYAIHVDEDQIGPHISVTGMCPYTIRKSVENKENSPLKKTRRELEFFATLIVGG